MFVNKYGTFHITTNLSSIKSEVLSMYRSLYNCIDQTISIGSFNCMQTFKSTEQPVASCVCLSQKKVHNVAIALSGVACSLYICQ